MLYSPTTTEVDKMNRTDLVFELSKKCHIDHYQNVIKMPTEMLRNLLNYYNDGSDEMVEKVIDFNDACMISAEPISYLWGYPVFLSDREPVYKKSDIYRHKFIRKLKIKHG